MKISPALKKVWNIVSTVIVALVVLIAVFLMGSRLVGLSVYNVISGSMSPQYNVGDLIYVKEVAPTEIKEGDVITFVLDENLTVATHRVVDVDEANRCFYTKGDANKDADQTPVLFENLLGTPVFSIPLLGYVSNFIQNPPGLYITIVAGVILVALVILPDLIGKKKKDGQNAEEIGSVPEITSEDENAVAEPASEDTPTDSPAMEEGKEE